MVMTCNLHNNLVSILLKDIEIKLGWVVLPHLEVFIACTRVDMHHDDELSVAFLTQIILHPEHLLDSRTRREMDLSLTVVIESIESKH